MGSYFAQVNIARAKHSLEDPRMADFVNNTARINTLAERSPGFIWRWIENPDSGVDLVFQDPDLVVNMSVWESREALMDFTYRSSHSGIYKRRSEWFSKLAGHHMVCWYTEVPLITLEEAKLRLEHLNQWGETPHAFSFRSNYSQEDAVKFKGQKNSHS
jgi:heme-degrading monooxygenase HmoA